MLDEETLVKQARDGDSEAFSRLYEKHFDRVYRYLYFRLRQPDTEDLAQDVFLKAFQALARYNWRGVPFSAWLLRIARNLYLRREFREKRNASLELLHDKGIRFTAPNPTPESEMLNQERGQAIQQALLSLSENDRTILLLSSQENMPYQEIAKVLDISISAVKVRIFRARQRFAIALNKITNPQKEEHNGKL